MVFLHSLIPSIRQNCKVLVVTFCSTFCVEKGLESLWEFCGNCLFVFNEFFIEWHLRAFCKLRPSYYLRMSRPGGILSVSFPFFDPLRDCGNGKWQMAVADSSVELCCYHFRQLVHSYRPTSSIYRPLNC